MASCIVLTALLMLIRASVGAQQGNLRIDTPRRLQDADCTPITVDFNTAANGSPLAGGVYVKSEWIGFGMLLTANGGVGTLPRLFDSSNPRGDSNNDDRGGDPDLGSPNESCPVPGPGKGEGGKVGEVGENCNPLGNVLIVQEANDSPNIPDDIGDGGTINFIFPVGVYVFEMGLLDADDAITTSVQYGNDFSTKEIEAALLGNNSYQTISIMTDNVRMIECAFEGSGAVTHITFCPVPLPSAAPTSSSTAMPLPSPSVASSASPTLDFTAAPTLVPNFTSSASPTRAPTAALTQNPTLSPSMANSTDSPSASSSGLPMDTPTSSPTAAQTKGPTADPTMSPLAAPISSSATMTPSASPQPSSPYILDFETSADGRIIPPGAYLESEWEEIGLSLSATGGFGSLPRAFDTENPGDSTTLGSPNERCTPQGPGVGEGGEPDTQGKNCSPLGNVLIVEAVGNPSIVMPSKEAAMIEFEFMPVAPRVNEIGLLNIDGSTTVTVVYETGEGELVEQAFNVVALGPNSYQTLNINLPNVRLLTVSTENGGAVAFVSFDSPLEAGAPTQAPVDVPTVTLPPAVDMSMSMMPIAPIPSPTEVIAPGMLQTLPPNDMSMSMMPSVPIPSPTEATAPSLPTLPRTRTPIVAQPSKAPTSPPVVFETVIEILSRDNRFSTLVSLVSAVGLLPALEEEPVLTVFAPTDEAFEALDLPSDTPPEVISEVLLNHVVRGAVSIETGPLTAVNGAALFLTVTPTESKINGADIDSSIPASDGIVIVIESVLIPSTDKPTAAPVASTPVPITETPTPPPVTEAPTRRVTAEPSKAPTEAKPTEAGLEKITLGFESSDNGMSLVPGLYVENEWENYGLILSASGGEGSLPRLYDTGKSNPQPDPDLGSPNEKCTPFGPGVGEGGVPGTKGENCEPLGNVLIIQEPGVAIPDDNADGGEIVFDFFIPTKMVYTMGFLDIDEATTVEVEHMTQMGVLKTVFDLELLGDNSKQELTIDIEDVSRIKVKLTGSGAVTNISFGRASNNGPTPTPVPITSTPTPPPVTEAAPTRRITAEPSKAAIEPPVQTSPAFDAVVDFTVTPNDKSIPAGAYLEFEYAQYGLSVSAVGGFGTLPRVVDSTNPGSNGADLGSPNERCPFIGPGIGEGGEPDTIGANCNSLGNVLVVQDATSDAPNDNEGGGTIMFEFEPLSPIVYELELLNVNAATRISLCYKSSDGTNQKQGIDASILGVNSYQKVPINVENVSLLEVTFVGTGAVASISFAYLPQQPDSPSPVPEETPPPAGFPTRLSMSMPTDFSMSMP